MRTNLCLCQISFLIRAREFSDTRVGIKSVERLARLERKKKGKHDGAVRRDARREFPRSSWQEDATPCRSLRLQLVETSRPALFAFSMPWIMCSGLACY